MLSVSLNKFNNFINNVEINQLQIVSYYNKDFINIIVIMIIIIIIIRRIIRIIIIIIIIIIIQVPFN